jgi:ABC-2 type transport system ATP-binding protein
VTAPALAFEGVRYGYDGRPPVVRDLDLALPSGVLGVIGNNGVGKSTLLKLAAGLLEPASGVVRVHGHDTHHGGARALTAFLPETLAVDGKLTPAEFLGFVGQVRRVAAPARAAMDLLERLGAARDADRLMRDLSFGGRRKVGLAAALLGDTKLLVLDEPGTGLDVASLDQVEGLIRERLAGGTSVVLSAHDMGFVARTCERVVVLVGEGEMREGTPDALVRETGTADLHHAFRAVAAPAPEAGA